MRAGGSRLMRSKNDRYPLRSKLQRLFVIGLVAQAVFAGAAWAEVQEEQKVNLDIAMNQNWVSGPGAAQSSLPGGRYMSGTFNYRYERVDGERRFHFGFNGRGTNDRTVDRQTWSLSNLETSWSDPARSYSVGDVMANFSGYSLTGAVKGASYSFRPVDSSTSKPEVNIIYGISYPRWENFWGGVDLKAVRRTVSGVNIRQAVHDKADFGISVVRTNDSGRLADWDELYRNHVYALDWEFRPQEKLTLKGETAFSRTAKSPATESDDEQYRGHAYLFAINQQGKRQKWSYEYEQVSPNFTTLLGSALADQERMKLKWTKQLNPDLGLNAGLAWSRNKLDGSSQPYRTDMYQPEIVFQFNAPFHRDNATLDLGMRLDRRFGGGISTADRSVTAGYRDVFGTVDADISLDYAVADTLPYDFGVKNRDLTFMITMGSSIKNEAYVVRPTLNISYVRNTDMLNHYRDRMFEASVGMGYTRLQDNFTANLKVGKNQNLKQITPDSSKWFVNFRMEGQPKYLRMLNQNTKQYLEVNINTYKFDVAGNNYRETSAVTGVKFEY